MRLIIAWSWTAWAQDFPEGDGAWRVLPCGDEPMTDPWRDEPGASDERDLVGDESGPTAARSADEDFVYLRMRLDQDPMPGGDARPFAWAMLLDSDGELTSYEVLLQVNGISGMLELYRNTVTTEPDVPTDPPDEPALASWPLQGRVRSVIADSTWGDNSDFWLELAVPWEELDDVGILPISPVHVWVATSSTATSLGGDFACHDASSGGAPSLSDSGGEGTVLDPEVDSDGDGFSDRAEVEGGSDPLDPSSVPSGDPDSPLLEGGGGCSSTPSRPSWLVVPWLVVLWLGLSAVYRPRRSQQN
jgi:hypothetical protein